MNRTSEFDLALDILQREVAASDLLPEEYARFRPLLADGLRFFLERLSPSRLRQIFTEQLSLPASASTAERLVTLLHHVPALHKLGQVVARDHRLSLSFRRRLQRLESIEPRIPATEVIRLLEREFKGWRKAGIKLGREPLAEGSVAVVMPFSCESSSSSFSSSPWGLSEEIPRTRTRTRTRTSTRTMGRHVEGVFKLLKPGIEDLLKEDLEILGLLGVFLDQDCERYHLPPLDYGEAFDTIRDLLLHEIRLDEEQQHLAEAAGTYGSMRSVAIPRLFPFCSKHMTVMERLRGNKLTEGPLSGIRSRQAIARVAAEALVAWPFFALQPEALFHADPHAGNLMVTTENRLGVLDWSLAGRLSRSERSHLVQLLLGALTLDEGRMAGAVQALSRKPVSRPLLEQSLRASLRELRWGMLPGLAWATRLLDDLVLKAGVRLGGDLLLFRKALLTLEGVLADVTGTEHELQGRLLDQALMGAFLERWAAEWPLRLWLPWNQRCSGTHLSTADVVSAL